MRRFALFVTIIIVALAPCILGQDPPPPPPPAIPDINPEAVKGSEALLLEIWPTLGPESAKFSLIADDYANRLETFEEAALRAKDVAQTRLGKELQARFTGQNPPFPRAQVIVLVGDQYDDVDVETVGMAATQILRTDKDPKFTDKMAKDSANGLMLSLGFNVGNVGHDLSVDLLQQEIIAMFLMCLITPSS